jgi:ankyrin repeat protein
MIMTTKAPLNQQLFEAIKNHDQDGFEAALSSGAPVDDVDDGEEEGGFTSLQMAAASGNLTAAKRLLDLGAKPDVVNRHGETALYLAALHGHGELVGLLTPLLNEEEGARDIELATEDRRRRERQESEDYKHRESFFLAVNAGNHQKALRFLPSIDVNDGEDFGLPLVVALERGLSELVPPLLEAGADVDLWKDQGPHRPASILSMAACTEARGTDRGALTNLLLRHGANPNLRVVNGETPLHEVALFAAGGKGKLGGFFALLDAGADLETRDDFGNTPWMLAAFRVTEDNLFLPKKKRRLKIARAFEKAGASTESRPSIDLLVAAKERDLDGLQAALAHGGNPDARTPTGTSALFLAVEGNSIEAVKILLEAGADPTVPNPLHGLGATPKEIAEKRNLDEIASLLNSEVDIP